jgi:hypothetical protein
MTTSKNNGKSAGSRKVSASSKGKTGARKPAAKKPAAPARKAAAKKVAVKKAAKTAKKR